MDKILNTKIRKAYNLLPSFLTEAVHMPQTDLGLGKAPIRERATQMGLVHLVKTLTRPSLRGAIAMAHVTQLATRFQHWPAESDTGIANLPTLRLLRCIHTITGLELLTLPKLRNTNQ